MPCKSKGHTDTQGQEMGNLMLSTARANVTFGAMVEHERGLTEHLQHSRIPRAFGSGVRLDATGGEQRDRRRSQPKPADRPAGDHVHPLPGRTTWSGSWRGLAWRDGTNVKLSGLLGKSEPFRASAVTSLDRALGGRQAGAQPVAGRDAGRPKRTGNRSFGRLLRRVEQDDWETVTLAAVTRAGRVAFEAEFRERRELRRLRDFYLREAQVSTREAFLGGLMSVYLGSYEPGARHTRALAGALEGSRERLGRRWSGLLRNVRFVLDSRNAARRLGAEMCRMSDPWLGAGEAGIP